MFLLRGLLFMLLGTYMLSAPARSFVALSMFFGVIVLVAGGIELVHAFTNRRAEGKWWRIAAGLFDVVLGAILVSHIQLSWRPITGIFNGLLAFRLKDANDFFNRHP